MGGPLSVIIQLITGLFCSPKETAHHPSQPPPSPPQEEYVDSWAPSRKQQPQHINHPHPPGAYPISPEHDSQPQSQAHPPPHVHSSSPPRQRVSQNQLNAQNGHFLALRRRANEEGDAMREAFKASSAAFERNDRAEAKALSNEGKRHQAEMERLSKEAATWIYNENNKNSKPGEIDLHGLYAKEAVIFAEKAIQEAQARGDTEIYVIVGRGLHSRNGAAKIKPAIEELIAKYNLVTSVDPLNTGLLIVSLNGRDRGGHVLEADELTKNLEKQGDGCLIM